MTAPLVLGQPFRMCRDPADEERIRGKIVVIQRGDCMFVDKVPLPSTTLVHFFSDRETSGVSPVGRLSFSIHDLDE